MDGANMNAQVCFSAHLCILCRYIQSCYHARLGTIQTIIWFVFTGGTYKPRLDWSRCLPSESPQDILHPSWRRWPWHGSYWSKETLGTIFTFTSSGNNFCSL